MKLAIKNNFRVLQSAARTLAVSLAAVALVASALRLQGGSFDGWAVRNSGTTEHLFGVANGNGTFVATGTNGAVLTSPDGAAWTSRNSGTPNDLNAVAYANGTFVAVGTVGTILTSTDGVIWTPRQTGFASAFHAVTYANGLFLAVGYAGAIMTSSNPVDWINRVSGTASSLHAVGHANGTFVAAGYRGALVTSPDAVTWTPRNSGVAATLYGITYGNGAFLLTGFGGTMIASPDGVTWSGRNSGSTNPLRSAVFVAGTFVVTGFRGTILVSDNGTLWSPRTSGTMNALRAVAFGTDSLVIAGHRGTILQSANALSPIIITTQPMNLEVIQGRRARFSVAASGAAPLRYQWFFNDSLIPRATRKLLMLPPVRATNAGNYFVVITNRNGAVMSTVATLTVHIPPSITQRPTTLIVTQGNNATFHVGAAGDAPLAYQWRFKNRDIPGATSDTYVLPSVALTNTGPYTVRITNSWGSVTSKPARLIVRR